MEGTSNPSKCLPTKTAVYIYAFLAGLSFGAYKPASIQAVEYLVSLQLGFEGKNVTPTGPCTGQGNSTETDGDNAAIQAYVNSVISVGTMVGTLPALFVVMFLSSCGDRGSRRQLHFVAVLPCASITLYFAIYLIVLILSLSPWYIVIAHAALAVGGGFVLQFATMASYLMFSTGAKDRSVSMIYMQTLFFSAQGAALLGVGYLIEGAGFTTSYFILFLISLGTTIFVAICPPILEEKSSDELENAPNGEGAPDPRLLSDVCKAILALFWNPETGDRNIMLALYSGSFLVYAMLANYFLVLVQIVVLGAPFCWNPSLIGYFGIATLGSAALGLLFGAQVLKRFFDDSTLIQIGFLSVLVSIVIPIYARTDAGIFLIAIFGCFRILPGSVMGACISECADKRHFGSLYGVLASLEGLAHFVAPLIFGSIYTVTVAADSMFVFKLMAGLSVIPSTLIMCIQCWNMTSGVANYKEIPEGALLANSPPKK